MVEDLLKIIDGYCPLAEKDAGEFATAEIGPMHFTVSHYDAKDFGKVSVMSCEGMNGLMKMDTVMVGPRNVDAPFLSYDFIDAMGNVTLIIELYDLMIGEYPMSGLDHFKDDLSGCEDYVTEPHWYDSLHLPQTVMKKGGTDKKDILEDAARRYFSEYMEAAVKAPACDPSEKNGKISEYCEDLLENGGPAVNNWLATFGKEKTATFLRTVLFDTAD